MYSTNVKNLLAYYCAKIERIMILKIKHFVVFITIIAFSSCKKSVSQLSRVKGERVAIDSSITMSALVDSFVAPYRLRVNEILDSTLAYAPNVISKTDGAYNTSAGNLMADIVLSEASPIFKTRTGKDIDFVLLNHGGIRSLISKGNISARTAYEVMPFENYIVVAELGGASVLELVTFLKDSGRAHPISGLEIVLNKDNSVASIRIQGKPLDQERTYHVGTSNYLVTGGDRMGFFKNAHDVVNTDYLIRNAMIDYFKKVDTVLAAVDARFIKIE